ncbi:asparaginase [Tropicibacter oceani]|uniref:Asparaginase n=1 Tax=Tropicibacter oceani TaxID=3058420 RepID=A0ABY8QJC8_9RHOB|nr:asparaginase [Tropicibacter oceani]WGW04615.1 asparaginase [Tropicibacter oceani]
MTNAQLLAETFRGPFLENTHLGHAVISDSKGIVQAWGNPQAVVLPRSSSKMIQALPLVTSGAADKHGLTERQLALACASHQGAPLHVSAVSDWLKDLGLGESDLQCGPQPTRDNDLKLQMIRDGEPPCQLHNNCSGKHAGFLTLGQHLGAGPDYVDPDHPVQKAALDAFETVTDLKSPGFGIDGCSAPNYATTVEAMARAMAWFATAQTRNDTLSQAGARLAAAMYAYPEMVAGEGRACTLLMRAANQPVALKTGADGYFIAILPQQGLGVALKIADGTTRAAESALAAILVRLGVLSEDHPDTQRFLSPEIRNWRGILTGQVRPASALLA